MPVFPDKLSMFKSTMSDHTVLKVLGVLLHFEVIAVFRNFPISNFTSWRPLWEVTYDHLLYTDYYICKDYINRTV